jgi:hypothetical protein
MITFYCSNSLNVLKSVRKTLLHILNENCGNDGMSIVPYLSLSLKSYVTSNFCVYMAQFPSLQFCRFKTFFFAEVSQFVVF